MCWEEKTKRTESYEDQSNNILKLFDKQRIPYWTIKKNPKESPQITGPQEAYNIFICRMLPSVDIFFFPIL